MNLKYGSSRGTGDRKQFFSGLLCATFLVTSRAGRPDLRCVGCKEIIAVDSSLPGYIRGVIELEGRWICVVDPNAYLQNTTGKIDNDSCILVVRHNYGGEPMDTGVLLPSFDEVLELAASGADSTDDKTSINRRFALELLDSGAGHRWVYESHRLLHGSGR